ncbi:hypothetical protein HanIR_Chr05g0233411 [Helianthus annuus]|nr:hypothetical protein HanIR_Chr05g0233411 [Helianthus annuus]
MEFKIPPIREEIKVNSMEYSTVSIPHHFNPNGFNPYHTISTRNILTRTIWNRTVWS